MERPTDLHAHLASRILAHIRAARLPAGHHLTEQSLQALFGTSRGPIRAALFYLEGLGVVERRPNRGFVIADPSSMAALPADADEPAYHAIAKDRIAGALPEAVSETELARRYDLSRHRLGRLLDRIAAEGWIEKRLGHGWAFLPLIDSPQAYRDSYELRVMLEPAAMRLPTFRIDLSTLAALEDEQHFILGDGFATMSVIELFEANSRFHETLAAMSGNRFVLQTIQRQNQLRRLLEYQRPNSAARSRRVTGEHLDVLERLKAGDPHGAADALARHLGIARDEKTRAEEFEAIRKREAP